MHGRRSLSLYFSGVPKGLLRHATYLVEKLANLNFEIEVTLLNAVQDVALHTGAVGFQ
jgi:hypothetical protein